MLKALVISLFLCLHLSIFSFHCLTSLCLSFYLWTKFSKSWPTSLLSKRDNICSSHPILSKKRFKRSCFFRVTIITKNAILNLASFYYIIRKLTRNQALSLHSKRLQRFQRSGIPFILQKFQKWAGSTTSQDSLLDMNGIRSLNHKTSRLWHLLDRCSSDSILVYLVNFEV